MYLGLDMRLLGRGRGNHGLKGQQLEARWVGRVRALGFSHLHLGKELFL